ncbi:unnamed protein product [Polarella glacialis]|uniref:Uncharacterized protein n=1 Tax=Polarella glacialis TaxID=89957 RepID=A0A813LZ37_POLGL|nr:unnamed protein product [Polarella glacialis]
MSSFRSWCGALLSFLLLLASRRFSAGWAAPSFTVVVVACVYIWCLVLRVPELSKELKLPAEFSSSDVSAAGTPLLPASGASGAAAGSGQPAAKAPSTAPEKSPIAEMPEEKMSPAHPSKGAGAEVQNTAVSSTPAESSQEPSFEDDREEAVESRGLGGSAELEKSVVGQDVIGESPTLVTSHAELQGTKDQEEKEVFGEVEATRRSPGEETEEDTDAQVEKLPDVAAEPGTAEPGTAEPGTAEAGTAEADRGEEGELEAEEDELFADPLRAQELRLEGNEHFKAGRLHDARESYSEALHLSSRGAAGSKDRAVLHCNRAACLQKLGRWEDTVSDCAKAIELDAEYLKAYSRRSSAYEELGRWHDALEDLKKAIELDPSLRSREYKRQAVLEKRTKEQFDKDKDDMMGKLKELGNTVLGKFGMSTENFKMEQDPDTGSYSLKFQQ